MLFHYFGNNSFKNYSNKFKFWQIDEFDEVKIEIISQISAISDLIIEFRTLQVVE